MKRIFDLTYPEYFTLTKEELKACIKTSEGRTVMSETVISVMPLLEGVSNPEVARSFGADMITLNTFDVFNPFIFGYDGGDHLFGGVMQAVSKIQEQIEMNRDDLDYILKFKQRLGRFVGVNLEPIRSNIPYPKGMVLNEETLKRVKEFGFDYLVITANPKTNVSSEDILWGIEEARRVLGNEIFIIAGKMHGAGTARVDDADELVSFIEKGADCVLIPAPMTVPGAHRETALRTTQMIHQRGGLVMSAIGTSQEGAQASTIEQIALVAKEVGVDIQHIGDAGYSGMAHPENIMALSIAIRGKRHTYRQIARSRK